MKHIAQMVLAALLLSAMACKTTQRATAPSASLPQVIAYYSGNDSIIDLYEVEKLDQIIFSFCHLSGNRLAVDDAKDSTTIQKLVKLKTKNPRLKVLLSLGGWGGCKNCSPVFSTDAARKEFAASVRELSDYFKTDGIDLDWEYPAIAGYPGHEFKPEDKDNFTALVIDLRQALGPTAQISFAAGGFGSFIEKSADWKALEPYISNVNLMSYDLVSGFSTTTGHHTALYSTAMQKESADNAIKMIVQKGFPANKIVLGCGFYARTWENVPPVNNGLYQPGKFKSFVDFRSMSNTISTNNGYRFYWDDSVKATHAYNANTGLFATFDDEKSVQLKTKYVKDNGLYGIMFWELRTDKYKNGLVDEIYREMRK